MLLGFNGSPKPNGNLRRMLEMLLESSGKAYRIYDLSAMNIHPCVGCVKCAVKNRCILKDDMQPLYDEIVQADAVVVGAVVFFGKANAFCHTFLERLYPLRHLNPQTLDKPGIAVAVGGHEAEPVAKDVEAALSPLGSENTGFGGGMTPQELREYHYKIMMPYFTDPVELEEFSSFEAGVEMIEKNLKAGKGKTLWVYSLKFPGKKVAVYGVGLMDEEEGEKHFLPIIGEDHLAAMPYEIILQGNTATMLHGRYRIALHWPDLTMGTFTKIMSTPGDIKKVMRDLCE